MNHFTNQVDEDPILLLSDDDEDLLAAYTECQPSTSNQPSTSKDTAEEKAQRAERAQRAQQAQEECQPSTSNEPSTSKDTAEEKAQRAERAERAQQAQQEHFEILRHTRKEYKKFDSDATDITLKLRDIEKDEIPHIFVHEAMTEILNYIKGEAQPCDKIGFLMTSRNPTYEPIWVSLRRADQFDTDAVLEQIEKIVQSNKEFVLAGPIDVRATRVKSFNGFGRVKDRISFPEEIARIKKSVIQIQNSDNLCLARAIVTGMALLEKNESREKKLRYEKLRKGYCIQKQEALKLCAKAGVNLNQIGGGVEALRLFQNFLKDYKITVFRDTLAKKVLFEDANVESKRYIDLWFCNNHYNLINSLTGFAGCSYYCRPCKVRYSAKKDHRCPLSCKRCLLVPACQDDGTMKLCKDCNIYFKSKTCLANHRLPYFPKGKTVCQTIRYCNACLKIYSLVGIEKHKCHHTRCYNCHGYVPYDHLCHIQTFNAPITPKVKKFIFFDLECRQDSIENDTRIHIPNFAVVQVQCTKCLKNTNLEEDCTLCGKREYILENVEGNELLEKLFRIFRYKPRVFDNIYVMAHNLRGYDGQFLLKYMVEKQEWEPQLIMNGGLIQSMTYDNLAFKDTLNFFNAPLAALPKMMGIDGARKGYFPHFFNTRDNQNYIGELPPVEYYGVDEFTPNKRKEFLDWWEQEKSQDKIFCFQKEMKLYCQSDVDILRKATLKFRDLFIKTAGVDPLDNITIAGACMQLFRTKYLKPKLIGLMPYNGYRSTDKQSIVALKWLRYMEHEHNIKIESSENGREKKIDGFKVDGYCSDFKGKPTIFEYHGCYFHGCPRCFPNRLAIIKTSALSETMDLRYTSTLNKTNHLKSQGYEVIEMWDCQFRYLQNINFDIRAFVDSINLHEPLNPRDAFFGGRTEMFCKYCEATDDMVIRYYDVCSLYPYICKYGDFPTGHPTIYIKEEDFPSDLDSLTGFIKLKILPPSNLYLPVLPVKVNGKLLFGLCYTCMLESNSDDCRHSEQERQIEGTFVIHEIRKALKLGYKIIRIYEIWSYKSTKFDGISGGIFAEYINVFLKIKQEASGFPSWVQTDQDKKEYVNQMKVRENIDLDIDAIESNPGLRSLAKMALNSLWGKFSQRPDLPQTSIVSCGNTFRELVHNPSVEVSSVHFVNDDMCVVNWNNIKSDELPTPAFSSIAIAAHVTAQARLYLYSFLEVLGDRVLYCDTDSVFFKDRPHDPKIEKGDFLGQMTDELDSWPGAYISEFVCEGPKNYAYKIRKTDGEEFTICKVRGLTLNYNACRVINFDSLKNFVVNRSTQPIKVSYKNKIHRKRHWQLITREMDKKYSPVPAKRRVLDNLSSLPFGYSD